MISPSRSAESTKSSLAALTAAGYDLSRVTPSAGRTVLILLLIFAQNLIVEYLA